MVRYTNKLKLIAVSLGISVALTSAQAQELPEPVTDADYYDNGAPPEAKVKLGNMLFFDKIMSGNQNISCATCHNPLLSSGDGLSLGVGEGGRGLGRYRTTGEGAEAISTRIGRHAPHLFNLGAKEFIRMNWNGIHQISDGRLDLPSNRATPRNIENVLAGQSLFPITNFAEMMGEIGDNEVSSVVRPRVGPANFPAIWNAYMQRLRAIPLYVQMFMDAYPGEILSAQDMQIQHYANAVAAFQAVAFRSDNSPFDDYLRGNTDAMTAQQVRGMNLFYGESGCSSCHSGKFQTDQGFHGIAMPQVGPGPEFRFPLQDRGRAERTGKSEDWAKFKTPSLRNVWLTAPYGHDGAYATLRGVIEHHLDPLTSLENYDGSQMVVAKHDEFDLTDLDGYNDLVLRQTIIDANELQPVALSPEQVDDIMAFLKALTDWNSFERGGMIPAEVPSGLPVFD